MGLWINEKVNTTQANTTSNTGVENLLGEKNRTHIFILGGRMVVYYRVWNKKHYFEIATFTEKMSSFHFQPKHLLTKYLVCWEV